MRTNNLHKRNKDADKLGSSCTADQLRFRHTDSTVSLFISNVSSFELYSVTDLILWLVCVAPGRKTQLLVFSYSCSNNVPCNVYV